MSDYQTSEEAADDFLSALISSGWANSMSEDEKSAFRKGFLVGWDKSLEMVKERLGALVEGRAGVNSSNVVKLYH